MLQSRDRTHGHLGGLKPALSGIEIPWGWSFNKWMVEEDRKQRAREPAQAPSRQHFPLRPVLSPQHVGGAHSTVCALLASADLLAVLFFKIYLFIYLFRLCWVFVSVRGLSPVAASGGHSSSRCAGLSLSRPLPLRSPGSRRAGSVIVAHGPSRSAACGILPDRGTNPCPLHWQADSQPLRHQGSPYLRF